MKTLSAKPNHGRDNPFPVYAQLIKDDAMKLIKTLQEARAEVLYQGHYADHHNGNMDRMRDLADMHRRIDQLTDIIEFANNMEKQQ